MGNHYKGNLPIDELFKLDSMSAFASMVPRNLQQDSETLSSQQVTSQDTSTQNQFPKHVFSFNSLEPRISNEFKPLDAFERMVMESPMPAMIKNTYEAFEKSIEPLHSQRSIQVLEKGKNNLIFKKLDIKLALEKNKFIPNKSNLRDDVSSVSIITEKQKNNYNDKEKVIDSNEVEASKNVNSETQKNNVQTTSNTQKSNNSTSIAKHQKTKILKSGRPISTTKLTSNYPKRVIQNNKIEKVQKESSEQNTPTNKDLFNKILAVTKKNQRENGQNIKNTRSTYFIKEIKNKVSDFTKQTPTEEIKSKETEFSTPTARPSLNVAVVIPKKNQIVKDKKMELNPHPKDKSTSSDTSNISNQGQIETYTDLEIENESSAFTSPSKASVVDNSTRSRSKFKIIKEIDDETVSKPFNSSSLTQSEVFSPTKIHISKKDSSFNKDKPMTKRYDAPNKSLELSKNKSLELSKNEENIIQNGNLTARTTRSGRPILRPLQWWKNEVKEIPSNTKLKFSWGKSVVRVTENTIDQDNSSFLQRRSVRNNNTNELAIDGKYIKTRSKILSKETSKSHKNKDEDKANSKSLCSSKEKQAKGKIGIDKKHTADLKRTLSKVTNNTENESKKKAQYGPKKAKAKEIPITKYKVIGIKNKTSNVPKAQDSYLDRLKISLKAPTKNTIQTKPKSQRNNKTLIELNKILKGDETNILANNDGYTSDESDHNGIIELPPPPEFELYQLSD